MCGNEWLFVPLRAIILLGWCAAELDGNPTSPASPKRGGTIWQAPACATQTLAGQDPRLTRLSYLNTEEENITIQRILRQRPL